MSDGIEIQPIPPEPAGTPYTPDEAARLIAAHGMIAIQTLPDGEQRILIPPDYTA